MSIIHVFLFGTPGCVGAGIDCDDVKLVFRIGFSTSILNFIQELGRCGRSEQNNDNTVKDWMCISFSIQDFVYLNERLFGVEKEANENTNPNECLNINQNQNSICSVDQVRQIGIQNLKRVAQLFTLNIGCWHIYLERYSANPFERNVNHRSLPCIDLCPFCDGSKSTYVKRVSRVGISSFLVSIFFTVSRQQLTPNQLAKELFDFPQVGKAVYGRHTSVKAESLIIAQSTILQLIAADIISMYIEESENPVAYCVLPTDSNHMPHYMNTYFWQCIDHF